MPRTIVSSNSQDSIFSQVPASFTVQNCYDSHVHWMATGEFPARLGLSHLKAESDVAVIRPEPHHFRGEWLLAYGWDHNQWEVKELPHRATLDSIWPTKPVAFTRADGHSVWVNSEVLRRVGLLTSSGEATSLEIPEGGRVVRDKSGLPTGVLMDLAKGMVDQIVPALTPTLVRRHLISAMRTFHRSGFTHIRDLTCSQNQWEQACHLEEAGLLQLAVEQFFDAEDPKDFSQALALAEQARREVKERGLRNLRPIGVKVFYDGALGSEGAFLSHPYRSGSGKGFALLSDSELSDVLRETWAKDFEIAIHTIGDEAAHRVISIAFDLMQKGTKGILNLEHAEILRPETIQKMTKLQVKCHLQPCHWLSDHSWLESKIGDLNQFIFPWRALQENKIEFDFGSDTPIEPTSLFLNLHALSESSQKGVPALLGDPLKYHSHKDSSWIPNTYSVFSRNQSSFEGTVTSVVFNGRHVDQN